MLRTRTILCGALAVALCASGTAFADTATTDSATTTTPQRHGIVVTSPPTTTPVGAGGAPATSTSTTLAVAPAGAVLAGSAALESVTQQQAAMAAKFQSTTAAMLSLYQQQQSMTSAAMLASLGAGGVGGVTLSADAIGAIGMDAAVSQAGISSDFASLLSAPSGIDGSVAAAGRMWAQDLAATHAAALGSMSNPASQMPSAQALGAMIAKSTTNMLNIDPAGFTKMQTGIPDLTTTANWKAAMSAAGLEGAGLSGAPSVLDPCMAAMLAAAGSGSATHGATAGTGCGGGSSACVTAGLYFHTKLLDAATGGTSANGVLPPADFNQLQPWQREALAGGSGGTSLTGALAGGGGGCGAASTVQKASNGVVPAAWKALSQPAAATGVVPAVWNFGK